LPVVSDGAAWLPSREFRAVAAGLRLNGPASIDRFRIHQAVTNPAWGESDGLGPDLGIKSVELAWPAENESRRVAILVCSGDGLGLFGGDWDAKRTLSERETLELFRRRKIAGTRQETTDSMLIDAYDICYPGYANDARPEVH
jgi:hypothetical protein